MKVSRRKFFRMSAGAGTLFCLHPLYAGCKTEALLNPLTGQSSTLAAVRGDTIMIQRRAPCDSVRLRRTSLHSGLYLNEQGRYRHKMLSSKEVTQTGCLVLQIRYPWVRIPLPPF